MTKTKVAPFYLGHGVVTREKISTSSRKVQNILVVTNTEYALCNSSSLEVKYLSMLGSDVLVSDAVTCFVTL